MEELKRLFNKELDSDFQEKKKESKQERGFVPEGVKIICYPLTNYVEIFEVESSIEYGMEYLNLIRIVEVMGFTENQVEQAKGKLLNGYYTIFDFDNKNIMVYDDDKMIKPIGKYLTEGKQIHEGVYADEDLNATEYDTETFSKWYNYIKN